MRVDAREVRRLIPEVGRWIDALQDWRPVFREYHKDFLSMMRAQFISQGGLVGGWQPLSPTYAARKERERPGRRIMVYDGDLEAALSDPGAPGQVLRLGPGTAVMGTDIGYAAAHDRGAPSRSLPLRQLIPDAEEIESDLAARTLQYLQRIIG